MFWVVTLCVWVCWLGYGGLRARVLGGGIDGCGIVSSLCGFWVSFGLDAGGVVWVRCFDTGSGGVVLTVFAVVFGSV